MFNRFSQNQPPVFLTLYSSIELEIRTFWMLYSQCEFQPEGPSWTTQISNTDLSVVIFNLYSYSLCHPTFAYHVFLILFTELFQKCRLLNALFKTWSFGIQNLKCIFIGFQTVSHQKIESVFLFLAVGNWSKSGLGLAFCLL